MEGVLHSLSMCELSFIISPHHKSCHLLSKNSPTNLKLFNVGTHRLQPRKFWEHLDCISVAKYCIPLSSSVVSYTTYRDITAMALKLNALIGRINYE